jgi:hypothetical protein
MDLNAKEWVIEYYDRVRGPFPGDWFIVGNPYGPVVIEKAMEFVKKFQVLADTTHFLGMTSTVIQYRIRNLTTGDILPAVIL